MTIRHSVPFALLALCCAGPVLAAEGTAPSTEDSARAGSEMVCRVLKVTGSRLGGQRVCKTRDQWRADQAQQRQNIEMSQQRNRARNIETGI